LHPMPKGGAYRANLVEVLTRRAVARRG